MSTETFETLQTQGGLLSLEYLHIIAKQGAPLQQADSYHVPAGLDLPSEINRAWTIARALGCDHSEGKIDGHQFVQKFLATVLGFDDIKPNHPDGTASNGHQPTHTAKSGSIAIVIAPSEDGLEKRQAGLLEDKLITPFDLAQIHLNNNEKLVWGIVADGSSMRLLRDSTSMTQAAYIEADLNRMLREGGEGHYSDFRTFYLLAHVSRFLQPENCILEQWHEESVQTGIRAHQFLRIGVEKALAILGTGFLKHQSNDSLRSEFPQSGSIQAFHQEILWLAYRLIFLLVTEDRGIIQKNQADEQQKEAYRQGYGISRLRARAIRPDITDDFDDLWEGLKLTFAALQGEKNPLALPALGGLFDKDRCLNLSTCRLNNRHLLNAVHHLSYFKEKNVTQRVNFRDMGADELGSIYESLLELTPRRDMQNNFSFFVPEQKKKAGNDRKTSGSYYTSPSLVEELVNSTLQPVLEKVQCAKSLLNLRVVDPACGSGHFLIAAARKMATKLVELRFAENRDSASESSPTTQDSRSQAIRDVISQCICGVEKNPMALDLAKTAMWLESYDSSQPLAFLDHHLQCGDSLLGVLNLDLLSRGIPDQAYKALPGDDKKLCNELIKANRAEREGSQTRNLLTDSHEQLASEATELEAMPDNDLIQIAAKQAAFQKLVNKRSKTGIQIAADMYVAAFLMPKRAGEPTPPTSTDLFTALDGAVSLDSLTISTISSAKQSAKQNGVFHWWLSYQAVHEKGGFDAVLANPPWITTEFKKTDFFARRVPIIANAATASERKGMIARLGEETSDTAGRAIKREYEVELRATKAASKFFHSCGNYPLSGKGKVNYYALFSELCMYLGKNGRTGIIVPTGIATGDTTKDFFAHLVNQKLLQSIHDFENRKKLFPSVDSRFRFCLLTIANCDSPVFSCFLQTTADLRESLRLYSLKREHLELVNPNTRTMPLYRARQDLELTEKIYRTAPILWREQSAHNGERNPWQAKFQHMFNMSTDSGLFYTKNDETRVRLYEGKFFHQYDHRFAVADDDQEVTDIDKKDPSFLVNTRYFVDECNMLARLGASLGNIPAEIRQAIKHGEPAVNILLANWIAGHYIEKLESEQIPLPGFLAEYADKISQNEAAKYASEVALSDGALCQLQKTDSLIELLRLVNPNWIMGWRNITKATDKFTAIGSILPLAAAGHTLAILYSKLSAPWNCILLAILNSLLINYVAAQKLAGSSLDFFLMKQLPFLPPEDFTEDDLRAIVPLVLELTFTANDLKPFYDDIVAENSAFDKRPPSERGKPYEWDELRRATLRAEIDARIALKYNISRDELRYILEPASVKGSDYPSETFRILQKKEEDAYGEFRTRRLVLEAYDRLTQANDCN